MTAKKTTHKAPARAKKKNPEDEKMTLTKGQLVNIIDAAAGKQGACKKAKDFCTQIKAELRGKRK